MEKRRRRAERGRARERDVAASDAATVTEAAVASYSHPKIDDLAAFHVGTHTRSAQAVAVEYEREIEREKNINNNDYTMAIWGTVRVIIFVDRC